MEVVDYPNYLIYPDGKVYSKKTKRYLRDGGEKNGYYQIKLWKDGKKTPYRIHRLVALHYISNPDNKPQVDHINRIKTDNRVENLRWVDISENGQNVGIRKDNKSGFKNICYHRKDNTYVYQKTIRGKKYWKSFKTLTDALVYKFIFSLILNSSIISKIKC